MSLMTLLEADWNHSDDASSVFDGKPFPVAPNDLPGYRNLRKIGKGGQGRVYRAVSLADGHKVAIKFYDGRMENGDPDLDCENALQLSRFKAESDILRKLNHPQLPRCFGVGEYHGRPYYVMELLQPFKVSDLPVFDDEGVESKDDTPIAEFLLSLLDVVEYLHRQGIVHQDIKPKNICWKNGKPALIDLGLVYDRDRMISYTDAEYSEMLSRMCGGSPGFCAPEQYRGKQKEMTKLVDIYAIGSLINECLRGVSLPLFQQIAAKCLNAHPAYRHKSIRELRFAIVNRHCLATLDIAMWGVAESNRQIRAAADKAIRRCSFRDLLLESRQFYDRELTQHGLGYRLSECRRGNNSDWWPIVVERGATIVDEPMHFEKPTVVHVMGFGRLEMTLTGSSNVVVVLDRGAQFVNRAGGVDSDEVYFLNAGCGLVFPNVRNRRIWNSRHRVFESMHNRPIVSFGDKGRDDVVAEAESDWKRFVSRHRVLKSALVNITPIDEGVPPLDISLADLK